MVGRVDTPLSQHCTEPLPQDSLLYCTGVYFSGAGPEQGPSKKLSQTVGNMLSVVFYVMFMFNWTKPQI